MVFFFFGDEIGVCSSAAGACFFFGEELGEAVADSSLAGEGFFLGDADGVVVGVGDFFFIGVELAVFFLRCGVGVGVEKIFLRAWPSVSSACATGAATLTLRTRIKTRRSM